MMYQERKALLMVRAAVLELLEERREELEDPTIGRALENLILDDELSDLEAVSREDQ